jgi:hypothetical protein
MKEFELTLQDCAKHRPPMICGNPVKPDHDGRGRVNVNADWYKTLATKYAGNSPGKMLLFGYCNSKATAPVNCNDG